MFHILLIDGDTLPLIDVTGIALDAISWKYYLVFVCLDVFFAFCWWMWGVETRGRTLEEVSTSMADARRPMIETTNCTARRDF